jgi:hypothetical protein
MSFTYYFTVMLGWSVGTIKRVNFKIFKCRFLLEDILTCERITLSAYTCFSPSQEAVNYPSIIFPFWGPPSLKLSGYWGRRGFLCGWICRDVNFKIISSYIEGNNEWICASSLPRWLHVVRKTTLLLLLSLSVLLALPSLSFNLLRV